MKKIIFIACMMLVLSSGYAAENKGAVVLNSKSWTTSGKDPQIHIVNGHLTEKKTKK